MIFSITIVSSPSSQASYSAYRFAKALLEQGYSLYRVFFYHDGVHHGSSLNCSPQDENDLTALWQHMQQAHNIDIVVCIAAAIKRGVLDTTETERYEKQSHNLAQGFELAGLGQLVDASVVSDRTITFGG